MVETTERVASRHGLEHHAIRPQAEVFWNLTPPKLYEEALRRNEGELTAYGPLSVATGEYTGRSPKDKFLVKQSPSDGKIWWGAVNQPFDAGRFAQMHERVADYLGSRDIFVQDLYVGADPAYRMPVRVVTEQAWHSFFARTMFIRPERDELPNIEPRFTVLQAPYFEAIPERDGTRSKTFILVNLEEGLILVGGTRYAGEIKKSIFSIMNFLLPLQGVMSMHCSANVGAGGDVALFFGLSGTGKTTLSSDPTRTLIGDDEHGWSDSGVFNFEGGCYAKVINLSPTAEPDIFRTTQTFGTIVENCILDPVTREIDYADSTLTENTRAAYPIDMIPNASSTGMAGHPNNIFFLSADAFGVLPPISRLTPEQASYYFLLGYTAKVAGTERGLTEPEATFSACFGHPFLTLPPATYGHLLAEKIRRHGPHVWLLNTGWTGGGYGVGERISIAHTREIVRAALSGKLADVPTQRHPIFGLEIPTSVPGVPTEVLFPRNAWQDKDGYDRAARDLAQRFNEEFAEFADDVDPAVRDAGPKV